jgi:hypothetical protein
VITTTVYPGGVDQVDETSKPAVRGDLVVVQLDDETLITNPDSDDHHVLNGPATIIWNCLDGESTLEEVSADLADAFGIDAEVARRDVLLLVRRLVRADLLEPPYRSPS